MGLNAVADRMTNGVVVHLEPLGDFELALYLSAIIYALGLYVACDAHSDGHPKKTSIEL